jgi:hypothetical protein
MRNDDNLQPFLVAFPMEEGGQQVMLDPAFFSGADEVGLFLADLARHYARAFVQSGRARDMQDALDQVQEFFLMEMQEPTDPGKGNISG